MKRREFIGLVGSAAAAWPLAVRAQQPPKMKRIAIVSPSAKVSDLSITGDHPAYRVLFQELRRLGCTEGQSLVVVAKASAKRIPPKPGSG